MVSSPSIPRILWRGSAVPAGAPPPATCNVVAFPGAAAHAVQPANDDATLWLAHLVGAGHLAELAVRPSLRASAPCPAAPAPVADEQFCLLPPPAECPDAPWLQPPLV